MGKALICPVPRIKIKVKVKEATRCPPMGNIGFPELLVIFVVALLVFGPKRLPELGRSLGRGLTEFRRASSDLKNSIEREMQTLDSEISTPEKSKTPAAGTNFDAPKS